MELLELEFRAKAIKALLRTQGLDGLSIDSALQQKETLTTEDSAKVT